jgi:hypothetical protein
MTAGFPPHSIHLQPLLVFLEPATRLLLGFLEPVIRMVESRSGPPQRPLEAALLPNRAKRKLGGRPTLLTIKYNIASWTVIVFGIVKLPRSFAS